MDPTVIVTTGQFSLVCIACLWSECGTADPKARSMEEEIFGPVLTIYVYPDAKVRVEFVA